MPQLSVAVHVLVVEPPAQLDVVSVVVFEVMATSGSQLSVAVGVPKTGMSVHSIVASTGINVNTGATVSIKVIT